MSDLFDTERCSLPAIPLVDFDFISECSVQPAPAPIFEQPGPEIAFNPAITPPDCPSISFTGDLILNAVPEEPSVDIVVTRNQVPDGNNAPICVFTADFTFKMPCPDIDADATAAFYLGQTGGVNVMVTKTPGLPGDPCHHMFDFDFTFPDPGTVCQPRVGKITFTESVSIESLSLWASFSYTSSSSSCKRMLDISLYMPDRRVFRGIIEEGEGDCSTKEVSIPALDDRVVTASVWLRNCCGAEWLRAGTRVWLTFDATYGWGIVSTEEILVAPIILTSEMIAGQASARLYYGGVALGNTFTVDDALGQFPCAFEGALGYAICNDTNGEGNWELINVQQYALWITFRVDGSFSGEGPITTDLVDYHVGENPGNFSNRIDVTNSMEFRSSDNKIGKAIRRDDCTYDTWQVQCSEASEAPPEE